MEALILYDKVENEDFLGNWDEGKSHWMTKSLDDKVTGRLSHWVTESLGD